MAARKEICSFLWKHFGFYKEGDHFDKTVTVYMAFANVKGTITGTQLFVDVYRPSPWHHKQQEMNESVTASVQGNARNQKDVPSLFILKLNCKSPPAQRITCYCGASREVSCCQTK